MRSANIWVKEQFAGVLTEISKDHYRFSYNDDYQGAPVSLTMPVAQKIYDYQGLPPFFEGLLPEGLMLEALLRRCKLDKKDYFGQLLEVGNDVVGAVTIKANL